MVAVTIHIARLNLFQFWNQYAPRSLLGNPFSLPFGFCLCAKLLYGCGLLKSTKKNVCMLNCVCVCMCAFVLNASDTQRQQWSFCPTEATDPKSPNKTRPVVDVSPWLCNTDNRKQLSFIQMERCRYLLMGRWMKLFLIEKIIFWIFWRKKIFGPA